ncbi:MAG: V-type ATP synthase subunit E [Oscillospiraceae bacterium]|nr:V-type ATP synthase subunit E [Oscillospiraceae bacterium]
MNRNDEKLSRFINAVNSEIDEKAAVIMNEAENRKAALLGEAESKAKAAEEKYLSDNTKKIKNRISRQLSKAELDTKKEVLLKRAQLTDKVFEQVCERLEEFRKTKGYLDYLIKSAEKAGADSNSVLLLAPADVSCGSDIAKALKLDDIKVQADTGIRYGGICIMNTVNGTVTDFSFDLALEDSRKKFAAENHFSKQ